MHKNYSYKKRKGKRKPYVRLTEEDCPQCRKKLAVWVRHSDYKEFIGCSGYPECKYVPTKDEISFAREQLDIPVDWRLKIDNKLMSIFNECQSSKEKLYLLGAIYYLNTDEFNYGKIKYNNTTYYGLVFNCVYQHLKMGGYSPTSLAIASQVEFRDDERTYHHDFGIFFSDDKYPTENDWWLGLAVEIDYHPRHEWNPDIDKYRDSLVKYKVLRLKKGNEPKNWFRHVEFTFNSYVEDSFENMKKEN